MLTADDDKGIVMQYAVKQLYCNVGRLPDV